MTTVFYYLCDMCDRKIEYNDMKEIMLWKGTNRTKYELCKKCSKELERFIKAHK